MIRLDLSPVIIIVTIRIIRTLDRRLRSSRRRFLVEFEIRQFRRHAFGSFFLPVGALRRRDRCADA